MELFRQGQFVIEDEEKEDANASTERPIPIDTSVEVNIIFLYFKFSRFHNVNVSQYFEIMLKQRESKRDYMHDATGIKKSFKLKM